MAAAYACNVPLVEALLERGASREARDRLGTDHALGTPSAPTPGSGAAGASGMTWDLVAPRPSTWTSMGGSCRSGASRRSSSSSRSCWRASRTSLRSRSAAVPWGVPCLPAAERVRGLSRRDGEARAQATRVRERGARRAEACSSYRPARRLWVRERQGHYVPNPALKLRVRQSDGTDASLAHPRGSQRRVAGRSVDSQRPRSPVALPCRGGSRSRRGLHDTWMTGRARPRPLAATEDAAPS